MSVGDLLSGIGRGVATAGRVAGTVLEPFGKALAEEESGQLPQIEAEKRQQADATHRPAAGTQGQRPRIAA